VPAATCSKLFASMPQHSSSCYSSGLDVPEAVFYRRHHRPRGRSETKPGLHGSAGLARRSTKPSLDYMCGATARVFSMATLMEETSSEGEGTCVFPSLAPAVECAGKQDSCASSTWEIYPSNQEGAELENSWEICSEVSDVSSFSLLSVATNETDSSWITVGKVVKGGQSKDSDSYASRLMKNGAAFQPCKPRDTHRPHIKESKQDTPALCPKQDTSDDEFSPDAFSRSWQKKQKGSRSMKAREKITASVARRAEQSQRDRLRATQ